MKLEKKKELAARTLGVGKGRIKFNIHRLSEIKEAITKQDIKELLQSGAIIINEKKGRKKNEVRKTRRRAGSYKKKVRGSKREYITMVRKLRRHLKTAREKGGVDKENYLKYRREIRMRGFKSLAHMKERIGAEKK